MLSLALSAGLSLLLGLLSSRLRRVQSQLADMEGRVQQLETARVQTRLSAYMQTEEQTHDASPLE